MLKPDWNRKILSISATLSNYLGDKNNLSISKLIEKALKKEHGKVVFNAILVLYYYTDIISKKIRLVI